MIALPGLDIDSPAPSGDLAAAARRRLQCSPYLPVRRVSCEHRRGVLKLRGRLPSYYLKQLAQEAVAKVDGVSRIENDITVD